MYGNFSKGSYLSSAGALSTLLCAPTCVCRDSGYTAYMSDQINLDGKEYTSSKRAAQLSGYTQDYVGQLARSAQIDAQRVNGLWYVFMDSLLGYKKTAEEYKPIPPMRKDDTQSTSDSIVTFEGRDYVSSSRASQLTGYHQDYVGQLARSGAILSRQVGSRWYVEREGLLAHKQEKDDLLAAVQAQAVGLAATSARDARSSSTSGLTNDDPVLLTYTSETDDLIPSLQERFAQPSDDLPAEDVEGGVVVPIRVIKQRETSEHKVAFKSVRAGSSMPRRSIYYGTAAASLLTVVIVLTFGFTTLKMGSLYAAVGSTGISPATVIAKFIPVLNATGDYLENVFVPEIIYRRTN